MSRIEFFITARSSTGFPCAGCSLKVAVMLSGMPTLTGTDLFACEAEGSGTVTKTVVTDAGGRASVEVWGGGCGCLRVDWTVDATSCGGPYVLCSGSMEICVKSPDITGDGNVNYFDTFRFLTCLSTATGYCCDLNCDGVVNFFDTFQYLPHLSAGCSCSGSTLPSGSCTLMCY